MNDFLRFFFSIFSIPSQPRYEYLRNFHKTSRERKAHTVERYGTRTGSACLLEEDESSARPAERLVRGGGDDVTVVEGADGFLGHNETRDVGHVAEAEREQQNQNTTMSGHTAIDENFQRGSVVKMTFLSVPIKNTFVSVR